MRTAPRRLHLLPFVGRRAAWWWVPRVPAPRKLVQRAVDGGPEGSLTQLGAAIMAEELHAAGCVGLLSSVLQSASFTNRGRPQKRWITRFVAPCCIAAIAYTSQAATRCHSLLVAACRAVQASLQRTHKPRVQLAARGSPRSVKRTQPQPQLAWPN